jgi:hypothetical protein
MTARLSALRHVPRLAGPPRRSRPYFSRADALDPNGYFTAANIGWHYVQVGDYAAARVAGTLAAFQTRAALSCSGFLFNPMA